MGAVVSHLACSHFDCPSVMGDFEVGLDSQVRDGIKATHVNVRIATVKLFKVFSFFHMLASIQGYCRVFGPQTALIVLKVSHVMATCWVS